MVGAALVVGNGRRIETPVVAVAAVVDDAEVAAVEGVSLPAAGRVRVAVDPTLRVEDVVVEDAAAAEGVGDMPLLAVAGLGGGARRDGAVVVEAAADDVAVGIGLGAAAATFGAPNDAVCLGGDEKLLLKKSSSDGADDDGFATGGRRVAMIGRTD